MTRIASSSITTTSTTNQSIHSSSGDGNTISPSQGPYEALQKEYKDMASWYDSFWSGYLDETLVLPMNLLHEAICRAVTTISTTQEQQQQQQQQQETRTVMSFKRKKQKKTFTVVVADVACGTGELLKRFYQQKLLAPQEEDKEEEGTTKPKERLPPIAFYGIEPCREMLQQAYNKFPSSSSSDHGDGLVVDKSQEHDEEQQQQQQQQQQEEGTVALLSSPPATTTMSVPGVRPPTWIEASAESLPLPDSTVDVLCSTSAFHFFQNKALALQQMRRVLKPGGEVIITDWCADYWLVRFYHWIERLRWFWQVSHRYPGPLRSTALKQLLVEAGFEQVNVQTYTVRFWTLVVWGMHTATARKSNS